jgi:hypothetical protein
MVLPVPYSEIHATSSAVMHQLVIHPLPVHYSAVHEAAVIIVKPISTHPEDPAVDMQVIFVADKTRRSQKQVVVRVVRHPTCTPQLVIPPAEIATPKLHALLGGYGDG